MFHFSSLVAWALTLLPAFLEASPIDCPDDICATTPATLTASDIQRQLGPLLSPKAVIYAENDPRFQNATQRWQAYMPPTISIVVQPGTEEDIPPIVRYANSKSVPFLTVNRAHGSTLTLSKFHGIEIYINVLDNITISKDQKSAHFQGGVWDEQAIGYLWDRGYVTNTGSCGCVGMLGPGLGGGHGRYQGLYGMISDTFISLNVVLADGTPITVSDKSHADLFWGMKGAGHNFGVVTSFKAKIFPRNLDTWYHKSYIFTGDKLEEIHEALNTLGGNGTQPKYLNNYGLYYFDYNISTTNPIVFWSFEYIGSQADAEPLLAPFDALGPITTHDGNIPYPEIPHATGTGTQDALCGKGLQRMQFPAGLQVYNITTQRAIYNLFTSKILANPDVVYSFVVMEGYSVEGVLAVDPKSSAYALRDDHLLMDINVSYPPNSTLDAYAIEWGQETVKMWNDGQPGRKPTTYVNYAFGTEPLEQMYGHEPWRLEKLRSLKNKYDPFGRFNYYNPIILN